MKLSRRNFLLFCGMAGATASVGHGAVVNGILEPGKRPAVQFPSFDVEGSKMSDTLQHENFAAQLNTTFHVVPQSGPTVSLKLVEVSEKKVAQIQERFSLLFQGPVQPMLPQQTYTFRHGVMGEFVMFIVPVGQNEQGVKYEAIFNRLIK